AVRRTKSVAPPSTISSVPPVENDGEERARLDGPSRRERRPQARPAPVTTADNAIDATGRPAVTAPAISEPENVAGSGGASTRNPRRAQSARRRRTRSRRRT